MNKNNDAEPNLLFQIIRSEDQIGVVLLGHLWVESILNEILSRKTGCDWSKTVYGGQFTYLNKVRIAVAFGFVEKDLFEPLKVFGELRNRLAHKLGYELTKEEEADFSRKIPEVYRQNTLSARPRSC